MPTNNNNRGRYWIATVREDQWDPPTELPQPVAYIKGQKEQGENTGYIHWQFIIVFKKTVRLSFVKQHFPNTGHYEMSRSAAADAYVWKEETRVPGSQFELGEKAHRRNSAVDWKLVKEKAKNGLIDEVDPQVYIQHYRTLKQIAMDNMVKPADLDAACGIWIHGPPGVGKSHYARQFYLNAYMKMCNKWWCGYQNEKNVIIDDLDKSHKVLGHHLKIWSDKYAFIAETKGYAVTIRPERIIVTSNYTIADIFCDDLALAEAITRRFYIIYMPLRMF